MNINPFRYRSYYYDTETNLYYLETRYYDPEIGRFINSDSLEYLGDGAELSNYNLFAYCGNNPINNRDPKGESALALGIFIGVSAIIGGLAGALIASSTGGNVLEGAIEGIITGAIAATATVFVPILLPEASAAVTTLVTMSGSGVAGMITDAITQVVSNQLSSDSENKFDVKRMIKSGFTTALASIVPTIVAPNACVTNAIGAAFVGLDASAINAVIEIIITNIFNED